MFGCIRWNASLASCAFVLAFAAGCGAPASQADSGGGSDEDAGNVTPGGSDAGSASDAGGTDTDAGAGADAGTGDAGSASDGGSGTDAGSATDAGHDAGVCAIGDALDPFGLDDDCDGADGEAATTIYVSATGSGTNPGTWQQPVQTLQQAVVVSRSAAGFKYVVIAKSATPYDGRGLGALLAAGLTVVGGYDATAWNRPQGNATARDATVLEVSREGETVTGPAADSGLAPPRGTLSDLELRVNDGFAVAQGGLDSVVLVVNDAPNLTLTRLILVATDGGTVIGAVPAADAGGFGADGGAGANGDPTVVTPPSGGGAGGLASCGGITSGGAAGNRGSLANDFRNSTDYFVHSSQSGGGQATGYKGLNATVAVDPNIPGGTTVGVGPNAEAQGGAADGGTPAAADGGTVAGGLTGAGASAAVAMSLSAAGVVQQPASTPAAIGRSGGGGGGGVSCGSWNGNFYGGGGGGAGGCGGLPGANGRQGGSAVGLIITGAPPMVDTVTILVGNGGAGQAGGDGGRGGNGGKGGTRTGTSSSCSYSANSNSTPVLSNSGQAGATGGAGGAAGGGGGGGTGGNGGLSVGVLVKAAMLPTTRLLNISVTHGTGGAAGAAGAGGPSGNGGAGAVNAPAGTANFPGQAGGPGIVGAAADQAVAP